MWKPAPLRRHPLDVSAKLDFLGEKGEARLSVFGTFIGQRIGGFGGKFLRRQEVGLGDATGGYMLEVAWPDGPVERYGPHEPGTKVTISRSTP